MSGTTLITGADGYIGSHVAARLLDAGDDRLILTMRAADRREFDAKRARLIARLGIDQPGRISFAAADVRATNPFRDINPGSVTRIVHAAALTRLNVGYEDALEVNVRGTEGVVDWARGCRRLEQFGLISTLYVAGRLAGTVTETPLPDNGFVNHYEWSKWRAEGIVLAAELPASVLRVPTVIAEDDGGAVVQFNAFHNTLKLLFYGLLSMLPGDPETRVPIATAEFVTDALGCLLGADAPLGIVNVCPDMNQIATLRELVDAAFAVFTRDDRFQRRGLAVPSFYDRDQFAAAMGGTSRGHDAALSSSLDAVVPFAEQLCIRKEFANGALRARWADYRAPDPISLASAATSYLVATRWGRHLEEIA